MRVQRFVQGGPRFEVGRTYLNTEEGDVIHVVSRDVTAVVLVEASHRFDRLGSMITLGDWAIMLYLELGSPT